MSNVLLYLLSEFYNNYVIMVNQTKVNQTLNIYKKSNILNLGINNVLVFVLEP